MRRCIEEILPSTAGSKKLEHGCRSIYAGVPSLSSLDAENGHVPNLWLLLSSCQDGPEVGLPRGPFIDPCLGRHMGGCQNYGPLLGPLNTRCLFMVGTPKKGHNFDNHPYGIARLTCRCW